MSLDGRRIYYRTPFGVVLTGNTRPPTNSRPGGVPTREADGADLQLSTSRFRGIPTREDDGHLTKPSGGGPGLQAGEESGPRKGWPGEAGTAQSAKRSRPSPFAYRSGKGMVKCEHAYGVQGAGLPHRAASGGAEPHVRLRTPGVEQGPRVAERPLPRRRDQNVVRGD